MVQLHASVHLENSFYRDSVVTVAIDGRQVGNQIVPGGGDFEIGSMTYREKGREVRANLMFSPLVRLPSLARLPAAHRRRSRRRPTVAKPPSLAHDWRLWAVSSSRYSLPDQDRSERSLGGASIGKTHDRSMTWWTKEPRSE